MFTCKQLPCAAEPGGDFIENQEYVERLGKLAHTPQILRRIDPHAAGTLHDGLKDDRCYLVVVTAQYLLEGVNIPFIPFTAEGAAGRIREKMRGQDAPEHLMHPCHGIADRHGAEGISVIPEADREELVLLALALGKPVLNGHLDCHFDRHRA